MPHWIGSTRLLITDPFGHAGDQVSTWLPTGGFSSEQAWFAAFNGVVQDGELSPDGTRLATIAATDGLTSPFNKLVLWNVDGPAWIGDPPYAVGAHRFVGTPLPFRPGRTLFAFRARRRPFLRVTRPRRRVHKRRGQTSR